MFIDRIFKFQVSSQTADEPQHSEESASKLQGMPFNVELNQ